LGVFLLPIFDQMNLPLRAPHWTSSALYSGLIASGLGGVFCSAMLYADTRRSFWSLGRSAAKFFGTTIVLGCSALLVLRQQDLPIATPLLLIAATLLKLGFEIR